MATNVTLLASTMAVLLHACASQSAAVPKPRALPQTTSLPLDIEPRSVTQVVYRGGDCTELAGRRLEAAPGDTPKLWQLLARCRRITEEQAGNYHRIELWHAQDPFPPRYTIWVSIEGDSTVINGTKWKFVCPGLHRHLIDMLKSASATVNERLRVVPRQELLSEIRRHMVEPAPERRRGPELCSLSGMSRNEVRSALGVPALCYRNAEVNVEPCASASHWQYRFPPDADQCWDLLEIWFDPQPVVSTGNWKGFCQPSEEEGVPQNEPRGTP